MATFNGSSFVREQLISILEQLGTHDELLIYDDASSDDTLEIIHKTCQDRAKVIAGERNVGVNQAFANCIAAASGDLIFMADQDDIWISGRLDSMSAPFIDCKVNVVATNHRLINENGETIAGSLAPDVRPDFDKRKLAGLAGIMRGNRNYYGCAMAFRRELREIVLPLPIGTESHDIWIAIVGLLQNSLVHMPMVTLLHRVHGSNASIVKRSLRKKFRARRIFMAQIFTALWRLRGARNSGAIRSCARIGPGVY